MNRSILAIVAPPDDAEFLCSGTLALLHQKGCEIHLATMTAGDFGTNELGMKEISEIRKKEAANSAGLLDANYDFLGFEDLFITYDEPSHRKTVALIRKVKPTLVFTMSPDCYMLDHQITSHLVRTACFGG